MAVGADSLFEGHPADDRAAALAGELFRQHSRMVLAVCRRLLTDTAEAEDAMQQTFGYASQKLEEVYRTWVKANAKTGFKFQ